MDEPFAPLIARRLRRLLSSPGLTVWWVDLDIALESAELEVLDAAESARADRFVRSTDGERYRVAHWALRWAVASTLARPIVDVTIAHGPRGAPCLPTNPDCHLSLSHSAGQGLVAISRCGPIGVDIEVRRDLPEVDELFALHSSPAELAVGRGLAPDDRIASFLAIWTRKEACLKALGLGLAFEPAALDVGPGPERRRIFVPVDGRYQTLEVESLSGLYESVGAVAWVGEPG